MRLDHIAYRVPNRDETVDFFKSVFEYAIGSEFTINFDDGSSAECMALIPMEKKRKFSTTYLGSDHAPFTTQGTWPDYVEYHLAPEIFVSEGTPGSIVDRWVKARGGIGGIHHMAYSTKNIDRVVKEWKGNGIKFLSDKVIDCPDDDMRQIFTKPQPLLGGMIIELIERGDKGFCQNSVKDLMESTDELRDE